MFNNKFKIKIHGRAGLTYKEGKKSVSIDSEMLFSEYNMVIYTNSIKSWNPPFDNEMLTEENKKRIISNIKKDFEKTGIKVDWEGLNT
jgi:hypothetical protein